MKWRDEGGGVWRASVGPLEAEVIECGAGILGRNIYVSVFAGKLAAVQETLPECKHHTEAYAASLVLEMKASLKRTA